MEVWVGGLDGNDVTPAEQLLNVHLHNSMAMDLFFSFFLFLF